MRKAVAPAGALIVDRATTKHGAATATFSPDRAHRYHLSRAWQPELGSVVWIMLNPSTADAMKLDPTVTRCHSFARSWGYGAIEVVNLFAYRATKPADMRAATDPIGPDNDTAILAAAGNARLVIAAWGTHGRHLGRSTHVRQLLADNDIRVHAVRVTKDGEPGHPLYVPAAAQPIAYNLSLEPA